MFWPAVAAMFLVALAAPSLALASVPGSDSTDASGPGAPPEPPARPHARARLSAPT